MKTVTLLSLIGAVLFAGGCASSRENLGLSWRHHMTGEAYRTQSYGVSQRTAFEAALVAVKSMGFTVTRSGASQGVIEAVSGLRADDSLAGSRQLGLTISLRESMNGTDVGITVKEWIEDSFGLGSGQATESIVRDTPMYEVFYRQLTTQLGEPVPRSGIPDSSTAASR